MVGKSGKLWYMYMCSVLHVIICNHISLTSGNGSNKNPPNTTRIAMMTVETIPMSCMGLMHFVNPLLAKN